MPFYNDLDIVKLFLSKEITIKDENGQTRAIINAVLVRDILEKEDLNKFSMVIKDEILEKFQKMFQDTIKIQNSLELFNNFCCNPVLNSLKELKEISRDLKSFIKRFLKNADFDMRRVLLIGKEPVSIELWEEIVTIFRLLIGEKVEPKKVFASKEAEEFYKKAEEAKKRVAQIKGENNKKKDDDWLFKIILVIIDAFPSFNIQSLLDMTLLQLLKLQEYAVRKYVAETKRMAFTNGNLKEMPNLFTQDEK